MGVERKFVKNGLDKAQMAEYFSRQLERAGYGGMNINRTPMGTQVTIFAEKPGMIIGKGGKTIHRLTHDLETVFHLDNPQIDVQEVKIPELNAQMMASRLAAAIERGLYFRKAGHNMLRRIMEAGALGCEIDIAGANGRVKPAGRVLPPAGRSAPKQVLRVIVRFGFNHAGKGLLRVSQIAIPETLDYLAALSVSELNHRVKSLNQGFVVGPRVINTPGKVGHGPSHTIRKMYLRPSYAFRNALTIFSTSAAFFVSINLMRSSLAPGNPSM